MKRQSYWSLVWQQYKRSKLALVALGFVVVLFLLALLAPWISSYSPDTYNLDKILEAPSIQHWFGTDDLGRDVLSRMIYGSRVSLSVGFVAIGIFLGALAGYYGGWIDIVISRAIEVMLCFPTFFLILAVLAFVGPSIYNIMIVIRSEEHTSELQS